MTTVHLLAASQSDCIVIRAGMLSYITQPQVTSPNSTQSPTAIRAGWASQLLSPKKTLVDENMPPHKVHGRIYHHTNLAGSGAGAHRRVGTWSHVSTNLQGQHTVSSTNSGYLTGLPVCCHKPASQHDYNLCLDIKAQRENCEHPNNPKA